MKKITSNFTKYEIILWLSSILFISLSFLIFDRSNYLSLAASLIGTTSLIFCAKANPFGQVLMIVFSIIYAVISHGYDYYGEMITYLGMTMPMAALSLWQWMSHPFKGKRSEVTVNNIGKADYIILPVLSIIVTAVLGYALFVLDTSNLIISIFSLTTSFVAAYLTFRRSQFFPLAYALNDIVLIIMWTVATLNDVSYLSVVICFIVFLINDLYGFISWQKIKQRQKKHK